jgi:hypothetical protein
MLKMKNLNVMDQKKKKFRLPRKTKKKLKKDFFTYPKSERNTYLVAWPYKYEEDYIAYKKGLLRGLKEESKKRLKDERKRDNLRSL